MQCNRPLSRKQFRPCKERDATFRPLSVTHFLVLVAAARSRPFQLFPTMLQMIAASDFELAAICVMSLFISAFHFLRPIFFHNLNCQFPSSFSWWSPLLVVRVAFSWHRAAPMLGCGNGRGDFRLRGQLSSPSLNHTLTVGMDRRVTPLVRPQGDSVN